MLRPIFIVLAATALAATAPSPESLAPKKTVAVLYFDNHTGKPDYDPLGKGIAAMMISDLGSVEEIQLVERERMQDVVKEMETQHTKFYDSSTAVKVGRLAGAEYIVVGAFAALQPKMRIDTRVVRVETGEIVKTAQVTGDEDKFFDLEQKLAKNLIDGLGLALSPEAQAALAAKQEQNRVDAVSTMLNFSKSLNFYDRGEYGDAAQMMLPVVQASPNSMLVRMTFDEMKRRAGAMAAQKAKDKIKSGIGGFLRRP
ncbi:MAG: FlgO family outer membrane protein [Gemmatimonadaceae bacterium]